MSQLELNIDLDEKDYFFDYEIPLWVSLVIYVTPHEVPEYTDTDRGTLVSMRLEYSIDDIILEFRRTEDYPNDVYTDRRITKDALYHWISKEKLDEAVERKVYGF